MVFCCNVQFDKLIIEKQSHAVVYVCHNENFEEFNYIFKFHSKI